MGEGERAQASERVVAFGFKFGFDAGCAVASLSAWGFWWLAVAAAAAVAAVAVLLLLLV